MRLALHRLVCLFLLLETSRARLSSSSSRRQLKKGAKKKNGSSHTNEGKKAKKKKGGDADEQTICNQMDPECGLSPKESQLMYLSTYEELMDQLQEIQLESKIPIKVGPLVKNGKNGGLLDIDIPLASSGFCHDDSLDINCGVCGESNLDPTIREAIICTVANDVVGFPNRGNRDPFKIGYTSYAGREIMAVELGNMDDPHAKKMFVTTQLHGNEGASTDGALAVLRTLTKKKEKWTKQVLKDMDIIIVLRVNGDGGAPDGETMDEDYPLYLLGAKSIFDNGNDKAFVRENLDPLAGGAFGMVDGNPLSEPDFFGTVGRGYNLSRYIHTKFDNAIRPAESQALVGAIHAFVPDVVFDMHGDVAKNTCELDYTTLQLNGLAGLLPIADCSPPAPRVPTMATAREWMVEGSIFSGNEEQDGLERLSQKISAEIANTLDPKLTGSIIRFSQLQVGTGAQNGADVINGSANLGAVGLGCEVNNFDIYARPSVQAVVLNQDGDPVPVPGLDTALIEPCYLVDNICLHENFLEQALIHSAEFLDGDFDDTTNGGYCDIPIHNNIPGYLVADFGWQGDSMEEPGNVPGAGQLGIPVIIDGKCPSDPART